MKITDYSTWTLDELLELSNDKDMWWFMYNKNYRENFGPVWVQHLKDKGL